MVFMHSYTTNIKMKQNFTSLTIFSQVIGCMSKIVELIFLLKLFHLQTGSVRTNGLTLTIQVSKDIDKP